jgi:hypothetical protein
MSSASSAGLGDDGAIRFAITRYGLTEKSAGSLQLSLFFKMTAHHGNDDGDGGQGSHADKRIHLRTMIHGRPPVFTDPVVRAARWRLAGGKIPARHAYFLRWPPMAGGYRFFTGDFGVSPMLRQL